MNINFGCDSSDVISIISEQEPDLTKKKKKSVDAGCCVAAAAFAPPSLSSFGTIRQRPETTFFHMLGKLSSVSSTSPTIHSGLTHSPPVSSCSARGGAPGQVVLF